MPKKGRSQAAQPSVFIEIVSNDAVTFKISLKAVEKMGTIKTLLSHMNMELTQQSRRREPIPLEKVSADLLRKIVEWCEHHKDDSQDDIDRTEMLGIQPWDEQFLKAFNLLGLYELIKATDFLDIKELMGYACKEVALKVKGFSPEQMKQFFELEDDDDEEEEEKDEEENNVEQGMVELRIEDN